MATEAKDETVKVGRPWFVARWSAAAILLVLPLVAMQFTNEVSWTLGDFVFAAMLIGGTGLAFELALRASASPVFRSAVALTLATSFLLIWVNGAVGIIGSSGNDADLLYGLVVAIIGLSAIATRFGPVGMMRATAAAAVVQALITIAAVVSGWGGSASSAAELLAINGFFILLWLAAMVLFRQAVAEASCAKGE